MNTKFRIRLLPIFIFVAFLTLSIKINNIVDIYSQKNSKYITISTALVQAQEQAEKETKELSDVLKKKSDNKNKNLAAAPSTFTQTEILILQELAERREALDVRAKEIDKRAIQLKVAEDEIDRKLSQLKTYEQKLKKLIDQYSKKEKENIASLVKLYTSMKSKDAARIFNTLDMEITVALLKGMKPANSSAILSQMTPEKARAITSELIGNNIKQE